GLIGSKTVAILRQGGHEVVAASPTTGVNSITGEGLTAAMAGAQVVIDLANAPSWDDQAVLAFFETSGRNLLAAEAAAGVQHHVAVSIVGTDRMPDNGYFRAQVAQEHLIEASGLPFAHQPPNPVPATPRRHGRAECAGRPRPGGSRPFPADRGGRRGGPHRRGGARGAPQGHRRDRRAGTRPARRLRRPLSAGGRRPACGRACPRGPLLRRPGRGALARAVGRRAPRPPRARRMAPPPLTGTRLILHPRDAEGSHPLARAGGQVLGTARTQADGASSVIEAARACPDYAPERNTMQKLHVCFWASLAALLMLAAVPADA